MNYSMNSRIEKEEIYQYSIDLDKFGRKSHFCRGAAAAEMQKTWRIEIFPPVVKAGSFFAA